MIPSKVVLKVWMFPLRARYFTSTRWPLLPYRRICARLVGQVAHRDIGPEAVVLGHRLEDLAEPALGGGHAAPGQDRALVDRELVVGQDEVRIDLEPRAEPGAVRAGAVRRVEAEVARAPAPRS